jgi:hypothetical protein
MLATMYRDVDKGMNYIQARNTFGCFFLIYVVYMIKYFDDGKILSAYYVYKYVCICRYMDVRLASV